MSNKRSLAAGMAVLSLFALAAPVAAHHGFTGRYDRSSPVYVSGVVRSASFSYPHAVLTLDVDQSQMPAALDKTAAEFADGLKAFDRGKSITVELPPVRLFFDLKDRIATGDRIEMIVLQNCSEPHQYRGQWVAPASGQPVVRQGRMQTEVRSC